MSKEITIVAQWLLKIYRRLHPYSPFSSEDSRLLASRIGFTDGSIDLEQLSDALNTTELQIPEMKDGLKSNPLSTIGRSFIDSLNSEKAIEYFNKYYEFVIDNSRHIITCGLKDDDDLDWLLSSLTALTKDEGWHIDNSGGMSMNLYARPCDSKRPPVGPRGTIGYYDDLKYHYLDESKLEPLFNHIRLPFTRKALWQAYLLHAVTLMVGHSDHGCYDEHRLVLDYSDLLNSNSTDDDSFHFHLEDIPLLKYLLGQDLYPSIITDTTYAMISHYWINDWKGLFQTHVIIKYNQFEQIITEWYRIDEKPIVKFDCEDRI